MRNLFWLLLFGNVIFFAVMKFGEFGWGEQGVQAQPTLNEEKIQLMPAPNHELPVATPDAIPAAPATITPALPSKQQPIPDIVAPETAKQSAKLCLDWGDFSGPDLARAKVALSAMQLGEKLNQRQVERDIGFWVYIPPLKNKAAIIKKIGELKALGVREYFVVQNADHWQNAISLGIFKTQEAAQNFLDSLHNKGVRSAKVGERASKLKATVFEIGGVDTTTEAKLSALQKDFAGSELDKVPCALTK